MDKEEAEAAPEREEESQMEESYLTESFQTAQGDETQYLSMMDESQSDMFQSFDAGREILVGDSPVAEPKQTPGPEPARNIDLESFLHTPSRAGAGGEAEKEDEEHVEADVNNDSIIWPKDELVEEEPSFLDKSSDSVLESSVVLGDSVLIAEEEEPAKDGEPAETRVEEQKSFSELESKWMEGLEQEKRNSEVFKEEVLKKETIAMRELSQGQGQAGTPPAPASAIASAPTTPSAVNDQRQEEIVAATRRANSVSLDLAEEFHKVSEKVISREYFETEKRMDEEFELKSKSIEKESHPIQNVLNSLPPRSMSPHPKILQDEPEHSVQSLRPIQPPNHELGHNSFYEQNDVVSPRPHTLENPSDSPRASRSNLLRTKEVKPASPPKLSIPAPPADEEDYVNPNAEGGGEREEDPATPLIPERRKRKKNGNGSHGSFNLNDGDDDGFDAGACCTIS